MFVSPDVIGMIISLFAFAVAMLGGVGWMLAHQTRRIDKRFDGVDARFDRVDARMDRMENRIDRLETRVDQVVTDLADVKVAVARWEGPEKHLQRI